MLNKAILMGRLTRDPELRYTQNNTPVTSFSIAVERSYGEKGKRETDFIDIVCWRKTAEFVQRWFGKGRMICVCGSIQNRKWQDKNGNNRVSTEVVAESVDFCGEKKNDNNEGGSAGYPEVEPYDEFTEMTADDEEVPF